MNYMDITQTLERNNETLKSLDRLLDAYFQKQFEYRWKIHKERMKDLELKKGGI